VAAAAITLSFSLDLSTATARLAVSLGARGLGQKLLSAAVGAKVVRLAIALSVDGGCFVHGHSADGIFNHGCRLVHGSVPFAVVFVTVI
jgi:hypothetical protein